MRFMMTIKMDAATAFAPTPQLMEAIDGFTKEMAAAGVLVETGGMASSAKITHITASGGRLSVTDGPHTESKEIVGGYAIIQVQSREEALEIGRRFMEIHNRILGPAFTADSEVQEMFPIPLTAAQGARA